MVPTINILILLTILYFVIGTAWAAWMHTRMIKFKYAKWIVFVININMWPECMVIWLFLQIAKLPSGKWAHLRPYYKGITLAQLLANQRALNKENHGGNFNSGAC